MRDDPLDAQVETERTRAYRLALGEFVDVFSKVETAMHVALRWYAKVSPGVARAVFSGVRLDQASDFLNRLARTGEITPDKWEKLSPIVAQARIINKMRNRILHEGVGGIGQGQAFVTNALRSLTEDLIDTIPVPIEHIKAMTLDLRKIFIHLAVHHVGRVASDNHTIDAALECPWLYIPPKPHQKPKGGITHGTQK
jgi:hypothetical protein